MSVARNLLITVVLAGGYWGVKHYANQGYTAADLAGQFNAAYKLPLKVDPEATLRTVAAEGDKLVFTYSLDFYNESTMDQEIIAILGPEDEAGICEMVKDAFANAKVDKDLILTRNYLNSYGTKIHATEVPIAKCA